MFTLWRGRGLVQLECPKCFDMELEHASRRGAMGLFFYHGSVRLVSGALFFYPLEDISVVALREQPYFYPVHRKRSEVLLSVSHGAVMEQSGVSRSATTPVDLALLNAHRGRSWERAIWPSVANGRHRSGLCDRMVRTTISKRGIAIAS